MSSVQEIENAIERLGAPEQIQLYEWLDERRAQAADALVLHALDSGFFDQRIAEALEQSAEGLDERSPNDCPSH